MHPAGEVTPVQVNPDDTIAALCDAADALDLFGDDLLDPDWLAGEEPLIVAGATRLRAALERYGELATGSDVPALLRKAQCPAGAADALAQFFGFVAETAGHDLVIEHLR
jgi:hypothetical protein